MWTVVVRDPQGNEIHRLPLEGRLLIGRTPDCQIVIKSSAVSRQHARLELFKDRPVFVDLGSSNGSMVNGQAVAKPAMVDERSQIEVAGFQIRLERVAAPPPAPAPVKAATPAETGDGLDLVPLRPSPPPTPAKPAPAAAHGDMRFLDLPSTPAPGEAASKPKAVADSAVDLLDQQLAGIRTYREVTGKSEQTRAAQVDAEWLEVLGSIRQLKSKIDKHPKVQHFTISRDEQEVSIKVEDSSKRGHSYYVLGRKHPTGKYDDFGVVWLCELGGEELPYKAPKEAMADLVRRLAPRLA